MELADLFHWKPYAPNVIRTLQSEFLPWWHPLWFPPRWLVSHSWPISTIGFRQNGGELIRSKELLEPIAWSGPIQLKLLSPDSATSELVARVCIPVSHIRSGFAQIWFHFNPRCEPIVDCRLQTLCWILGCVKRLIPLIGFCPCIM